jgi:hypothetical protein
MATRARIAFETKVGEIVSAYHHWDGYPAGLGYNLIKNYAGNRDKFMEAVMLGDASHWGKTPYPTTSEHSFDNAEDDVSVYYGRDRGEKDVGAVTFTDMDDFAANWDMAGEEYAYVLRLDGKLTMIERYADNRVTEDAEDEIILARAAMLHEYKKRMAA